MTRVLLVDDEPALLDIEGKILERKFGISVETAASGEEALEILKVSPFDAIVSDYSMPGIDGLTLLRRIREQDKQIPFILFTVKEREAVAIEALNSGANFYVQKEESPQVAFTELAHKINISVELVRAERNLRIQRDLAISCANTKELTDVLHLCLKAARDASNMDAAAIYLIDERNHLILQEAEGFSGAYADHAIQAHLIPLFFSILRSDDNIFRNADTIAQYSQVLTAEEAILSDCIISLQHHGNPIGLIHLVSHTLRQSLSPPMQQSVQGICVQISGHISDRIAEDALWESERMVKTLIGNLPGMVYKCEFSDERPMEFVSDGSIALTGHPPSDLIGEEGIGYTSLIHPDDRSRIMEVIRRAITRKVQYKLTYRIFTNSMKFKWVLEQGVGVYNDAGNVSGLEGFIIDITRQKVLDDQVKISQNRLNLLFTNMNAGCAIFLDKNRDGRYKLIEINKTACEIEGKSKDEMLGRSIFEFFSYPPPESLRIAIQDLITHGTAQNLPRIPIHTDRQRRWIEIYLSGSTIGDAQEIFLIYSDVTDRVKDEEQIIASLKEKELLLKEVHHRVKNNLQIIAGILKLQAMRTEDPLTNEILQDCRNQVFSMASIHELLYSSRDLGNISVHEYVGNLINHFKQEYQGSSKNITYVLDVDPSIILDIERCIPCGLILNELITNAVKYAFDPGEDGDIVVRFTHVNKTYQMQVSDNGKGMPPDYKPGTRNSLGTELVTRLTHQLKGEMRVTGGKGTTITITFQDYPEEKGST